MTIELSLDQEDVEDAPESKATHAFHEEAAAAERHYNNLSA
jgi:hypothetical protein